jgi:hypothetical protein
MKRAVLLVAAALSMTAAPVAAQDTPEALAAAYMEANRSGDWFRVAALMHPEAVTSFKEMFGAIISMDGTGEFREQFFDVESDSAFQSLAPDSLFGMFMTKLVTASPELGGMLGSSKTVVIGHVSEEALGLTHVVVRMSFDMQGMQISKIDVIPMKRHNGQWRAMLTGDIENMVAALKMQMGGGM